MAKDNGHEVKNETSWPMITVTKSEVKVHDLEKGKNLFKFWVMTKKIGNGKSYLLGTSLFVLLFWFILMGSFVIFSHIICFEKSSTMNTTEVSFKIVVCYAVYSQSSFCWTRISTLVTLKSTKINMRDIHVTLHSHFRNEFLITIVTFKVFHPGMC